MLPAFPCFTLDTLNYFGLFISRNVLHNLFLNLLYSVVKKLSLLKKKSAVEKADMTCSRLESSCLIQVSYLIFSKHLLQLKEMWVVL